MTTVQIPQAHGEAIAARMQLMQQVLAHFQLLHQEDKRHVDAVLKSLGHEPENFEKYDLKRNAAGYCLELTPKAALPLPAPQPVAQPVNGEAQPPVA